MENQTIENQKPERGSETMTVAEAAYMIGCGMDTIKAWHRAKLVDWCFYAPPEKGKSNGTWLVRREAFMRWLGHKPPEVKQEIIISTPEAYEMLRRVIITNV